jgi:hypothetical protein
MNAHRQLLAEYRIAQQWLAAAPRQDRAVRAQRLSVCISLSTRLAAYHRSRWRSARSAHRDVLLAARYARRARDYAREQRGLTDTCSLCTNATGPLMQTYAGAAHVECVLRARDAMPFATFLLPPGETLD